MTTTWAEIENPEAWWSLEVRERFPSSADMVNRRQELETIKVYNVHTLKKKLLHSGTIESNEDCTPAATSIVKKQTLTMHIRDEGFAWCR